MTVPTPFPELNDVLRALVAGARDVLRGNHVGSYLHGAFAVGDADEHSDVDFLVVTRDAVRAAELRGLQALHARLYSLESPWAQHLEGSYVPAERLRRVDPWRSGYWYLDNGATELVWDNHDNSAVVRWSLRERGITLEGPEPKELIDPVSPDQLRTEAALAMQEYADWAKALEMSRRAQGLLVLTICRMLMTLEVGRVPTKREAGEWAIDALAPEWSDLIRGALDDRENPWPKVRAPASSGAVARTLEFFDYALAAARDSRGTPSAAR